MSTVLVTGSEGNIGSFIIEQFHRQFPQWTLVRVSRSFHGDPSVEIGDLREEAFVHSLFQKYSITHVIHAAATPYNVPFLKEHPFDVFFDDVRVLMNALSESRSVKKFVYLSSVTVYEGATQTPFTEEMTTTIGPPRSPHGLAKYVGERAVKLFAEQYDIDFTIWRLFNVVSPRENHERSGAHVYIDFYRKLFVDRVPVLDIFGDGQQIRCFTWVEDVARAVARFLDDARTTRETFNLGGCEQKTLLTLKDELLAIGRREGILPHDYRPETRLGEKFAGVDSKAHIPSLEKIERLLGWVPETDFAQCFEKFILKKQHYAHS